MAKAPLTMLAATAVLTAAGVLSADPRAPTPTANAEDTLSMHAEHLDVDVEAKRAVLTGNVVLTKGAMSVSAPRVDVRYDEVPHVTWLKASGGIVAEVKGVHAEAPEGELDLAEQTLELRGGVKLTQSSAGSRAGGWLTADRATIHLATSKVSMSDVKGSIPVGSAAPPTRLPP